jgi:hypothetical protein
MTRAKLTSAILLTTALVGACAASSADTFNRLSDPEAAKGPGENDAKNGGATAPSNAFGPTGTGVILVHAAKFLSFRLCFENQMDLPPQPDATVMPEANVVGLEVGSVVRLDPLKPPGRIRVVREVSVRGRSGSCKDLDNAGFMRHGLDFQYATLDDPNQPPTDGGAGLPIGEGKVQLLAITGCGGGAFLPSGASKVDCGSDYDDDEGNLKASVVDLAPSSRPALDKVPLRLVHLSPSIEASKGDGVVEVSFGDLALPASLPAKVATNPTLLSQSDQTTVTVEQDAGRIFATHGFRIGIVPRTGPFRLLATQSLADVQDLSAPRDNPTAYYQAASNYALLLLGDPAADPGPPETPDPTFARRGVHLLAIPIIDPTTVPPDAPDGGRGPDGG